MKAKRGALSNPSALLRCRGNLHASNGKRYANDFEIRTIEKMLAVTVKEQQDMVDHPAQRSERAFEQLPCFMQSAGVDESAQQDKQSFHSGRSISL